MQPFRTTVEREAGRCYGIDAAADAVTGFERQHLQPAGLDEPARGANTGGAGADHRDIHLGGESRHRCLQASLRCKSIPGGGQPPGCIMRLCDFSIFTHDSRAASNRAGNEGRFSLPGL